MQPSSFNKAVSSALSMTLMALQHVYTYLYGYREIQQVHMYASYHLYSCLALTLERQKRHITIADLQSYILPNISLCYYLQVQVTYLGKLCRECCGTAPTCMNSGYQALSQIFVERLGTRLILVDLVVWHYGFENAGLWNFILGKLPSVFSTCDHGNLLNWLLLFLEHDRPKLDDQWFSLLWFATAYQLYCSLLTLAVRATSKGTKTQRAG